MCGIMDLLLDSLSVKIKYSIDKELSLIVSKYFSFSKVMIWDDLWIFKSVPCQEADILKCSDNNIL